MQYFQNADGKPVLLAMVKGIQENKQYLGDVDGLIGDGDHGMNMNKGFSTFEKRFADQEFTFTEGLNELAMILMNEIGGSMGPIYGTILMGMADQADEDGAERIDVAEFTKMMQAGLDGLYDIVDARPGDKTLVDTLYPAVQALKDSAEKEFAEALEAMKEAAIKGNESTKEMVAKYGRSARLGERSKGVLDAGSCSCRIILCAMADGIKEIIK